MRSDQRENFLRCLRSRCVMDSCVFPVLWVPAFQTSLLVIFHVFPFLYLPLHTHHIPVFFPIPVFFIPAFQTGPRLWHMVIERVDFAGVN